MVMLAALGGGPKYNIASGGTVSSYSYGGNLWKRHTFTSSGTFTIAKTITSYRVTMIGGGGDGGYADCPTDCGTWGGYGGGYLWVGTLNPGAVTVTVGANNGSTTVAGVGTVGNGGHGCRNWNDTGWSAGGAGTWGGTSSGSNGEVCNSNCYAVPADNASGVRTLQDGTVLSGYGAGGASAIGACTFNSGTAGIVVIDYITL